MQKEKPTHLRFDNVRQATHRLNPLGETNMPAGEQTKSRKVRPIMGDRSPKSVNKQAAQKQAKANTANQNKQQAIAAKQAANKKK